MSLTDKVLASGLVDRHTVELMERWGYLSGGSADKVNEEALKNATREQLTKLAVELDNAVDHELRLRETRLDLEKIKWPTTVDIYRENIVVTREGGVTPEVVNLIPVAMTCPAVMDRQGRYYFRIDDVQQEWFVIGYFFKRQQREKGLTGGVVFVREEVLEAQTLFVGDLPVCVQVTTRPA